MNDNRKNTNWVPPLMVLAAPAGTYTLIRFGPEHGWDTAALWALAALLLVLMLPQLLRAGAKAGRAAKPTKKASTTKK